MATSKERDKEHGKGHLAMNTPPIVSQQEWELSNLRSTNVPAFPIVSASPAPMRISPSPG